MIFNLHGKTQYAKLHLGYWGFVCWGTIIFEINKKYGTVKFWHESIFYQDYMQIWKYAVLSIVKFYYHLKTDIFLKLSSSIGFIFFFKTTNNNCSNR